MLSDDKFIDSVLSFLSEDEKFEDTVTKSTDIVKIFPMNSRISTDTEVQTPKNNRKCSFCYKNGEVPQVYMGHVLKNANGSTICPILRKFVCALCGASGDTAHTKTYCPLYTQDFVSTNVEIPQYKRLSNGKTVWMEKR